ncbi:MAG: hypothetical protein M1282_04600, partial [Chloroflexi bacterium]|nr:hypothetical protein [Chloroflexota bacterium]
MDIQTLTVKLVADAKDYLSTMQTAQKETDKTATGIEEGVQQSKNESQDFFSTVATGVASGIALYMTYEATIATVAGFEQKLIDTAAEGETAQVQLATALRATGRDSEISAGQIDKIATSLMNVSAF